LFDSWLRILAAAPGSVLWLLAGGGERRLREHARQKGIDPARLIFATLLPKPEHLARFRIADLFLDTYTCNAHTTASDSLWAGVPVLTCSSPGFAGRVAASLLKAAGLPELIAPDRPEYERRAVAFARNPEALRALTHRLRTSNAALPLFDTVRYARDLEKAYETMWARHCVGAAPERFAVD
jgi:protein O-GlcNAc transferase